LKVLPSWEVQFEILGAPMATFDPGEVKRVLDGKFGIRWIRSSDFEEYRVSRSLAWNVELIFIPSAIRCFLVGYDQDARALLEQGLEWLSAAIENERPADYVADDTESTRYFDLASCRWLLKGERDEVSLRKAVDHSNRYLSTVQEDLKELSLRLARYVEAGAFREAILHLEKDCGLVRSFPASLSAITSDAQLELAIGWNEAQARFPRADVSAAGERFLRRNMNAWLTSGQMQHAVDWLRIVARLSGASLPSPGDLVRKCYEYMDAKLKR
jgi:hypothetical protein